MTRRSSQRSISCWILNISAILALMVVDFSLAQQTCSSSKPCSGQLCCSKFGFCGTTPDHCGAGCISNCNSGTTGQCGPNRPCSGGLCCSKFGFCGSTSDHCGAGCQSNCNSGTPSTTGQCGPNRPCAGGLCCSRFGFCGSTSDHCGAGCQSNCGASTTTTTTTTTTQRPVDVCSPQSPQSSLCMPFIQTPAWNMNCSQLSVTLRSQRSDICSTASNCQYLNWINVVDYRELTVRSQEQRIARGVNSFSECFDACIATSTKDCVAVVYDKVNKTCQIYTKVTMNPPDVYYPSDDGIDPASKIAVMQAPMTAPVVANGEWLAAYPMVVNIAPVDGSVPYFRSLANLTFDLSKENANAAVAKCLRACLNITTNSMASTCWAANLDLKTGRCNLIGEPCPNCSSSWIKDALNTDQITVTYEAAKVSLVHRSIWPTGSDRDQLWRFSVRTDFKLNVSASFMESVNSQSQCLEICLKNQSQSDSSCRVVSHVPYKATSQAGDCFVYNATGELANRIYVKGKISTIYLETRLFNKSSAQSRVAQSAKPYGPLVLADTLALGGQTATSSSPDVNSCLNLALQSSTCTKFTYDPSTRSCYLLDDWAHLAAGGALKRDWTSRGMWNQSVANEMKSVGIVMPKQLPDRLASATSYILHVPTSWEYLNFMRMPGYYVGTKADIQNAASGGIGSTTTGEVTYLRRLVLQETSALRCLIECRSFPGERCSAISARYLLNSAGSRSIECTLYEDQNLNKLGT